MISFVTDNHLHSFENWLLSQKYQTNTIRNYLLDIKYFLVQTSSTLSVDSITDFIARDIGQNNHSRHLASLSKFCQFASDQQLTEDNLFLQVKKHKQKLAPTKDLNLLLSQFAQKLVRDQKSPTTIKNYLGDIRQYISFCESQTL